jgi:hypothetical protein
MIRFMFVVGSAAVAALVTSCDEAPEPASEIVQVTEAMTTTDGFDYPVGPPDGSGYYNAQDFGVWNDTYNGYHLGEDWNGNDGGNTDCDDPVYASANGDVIFNGNGGTGWGNTIILEHTLPDNTKLWTMYAHMNTLLSAVVTSVQRGEQIGTIGDGSGDCDGSPYYAHLHFEMRDTYLATPGPGYSESTAGWIDPSNYIDANRPGASEDCAPGCPDGWIGDGFCDPACYNASCIYDDGDCECAPGCPDSWIGDGICDSACNNSACSYDGGDCGSSGDCATGCPEHWIGDGVCDSACNNSACSYDGGDCGSSGDCATGCPEHWIGDGFCDSACNNSACSYDGGDC